MTNNIDRLLTILEFVSQHSIFAPSATTAQGRIIGALSHARAAGTKITKNADFLMLLKKYEKARDLPIPKPMCTAPDPAVAVLMQALYGHGDTFYINVHREAMSAENLIGSLLESYIAEKIEPNGWIWCAGAFVTSIDFIKKCSTGWEMLQTKNRSNTENSSSKRVRKGTSIKHWYRVDANTGATKWQNFPDTELVKILSEDGFHDYIKAIAKVWKDSFAVPSA